MELIGCNLLFGGVEKRDLNIQMMAGMECVDLLVDSVENLNCCD